MLRICIVCNISRQMLCKKSLSNMIHVKLSKSHVFLSIIRSVSLTFARIGKLPCIIDNFTNLFGYC